MAVLTLIPLAMMAGLALPAQVREAQPAARTGCKDMPRMVAAPRPGRPQAPRTLAQELPARHIAAVYAERQGCPVVLVLDRGAPKWQAAPGADVSPVR